MTATDVFVSSSSANAGIILRAKSADEDQSVTNGSSNNIKVYPPSGAKINNGSADAAIVLVPNGRVSCKAYSSVQYLCTYASLFDATAAQFSALTTATNVGTVTSDTESATEYGDGINHVTKIAMTSFVIGTSADNAALAIGAKFYTWPASTDVYVDHTVIDGGITCAISVTTETPEVGMGTVIASGANATLNTGTWEVFMDGGATRLPTSGGDQVAVAPDVAGAAFRKVSLSTASPVIKASGGAARDVFLNIAVTWADVTAAGACTFTGNVWLNWSIVG